MIHLNILFTMAIPTDLKQKQEQQFPEHTYNYIEDIALYENLAEIDCIVSYGSDITEAVLEKAKGLRWLMVFSAGVEELPHAKLQEKKYHSHQCSRYSRDPDGRIHNGVHVISREKAIRFCLESSEINLGPVHRDV